MKRVASVIISLMMLMNVSLGYMLTVNTVRGTTTRDVAEGKVITLGLSNRSPATFEVNTANVVLKVFGNRRQFVMPAESVDISITPKDNTTKSVLDMQVGDYVTYYPTETEVDLTELTGIEQESFNPTLTTQWRVLSNDGTKVEIVSADSVGDLTLSEFSERGTDGTFTEGSQEIYEIAQTNYANVIYILNQISEMYAQGVGSGRGLGWNGTSLEEIDVDTLTYSYIASNNITPPNGDPYDDTYYQVNGTIADVEVLNTNDMLQAVWLASRRLSNNISTYAYFGVRVVDDAGNIDYYDLCGETSLGDADSDTRTCGVRPVIILNSDLEVEVVGTEGNSWKIN